MVKQQRFSLEEVKAAEKVQNGGRYRLICNRNIGGRKCVCYANEVKLGDNRYWNVKYKIDGKIAETFNELVNAMYHIAVNLASNLSSIGTSVVMWTY
jgi:hypothetical protein